MEKMNRLNQDMIDGLRTKWDKMQPLRPVDVLESARTQLSGIQVHADLLAELRASHDVELPDDVTAWDLLDQEVLVRQCMQELEQQYPRAEKVVEDAIEAREGLTEKIQAIMCQEAPYTLDQLNRFRPDPGEMKDLQAWFERMKLDIEALLYNDLETAASGFNKVRALWGAAYSLIKAILEKERTVRSTLTLLQKLFTEAADAWMAKRSRSIRDSHRNLFLEDHRKELQVFGPLFTDLLPSEHGRRESFTVEPDHDMGASQQQGAQEKATQAELEGTEGEDDGYEPDSGRMIDEAISEVTVTQAILSTNDESQAMEGSPSSAAVPQFHSPSAQYDDDPFPMEGLARQISEEEMERLRLEAEGYHHLLEDERVANQRLEQEVKSQECIGVLQQSDLEDQTSTLDRQGQELEELRKELEKLRKENEAAEWRAVSHHCVMSCFIIFSSFITVLSSSHRICMNFWFGFGCAEGSATPIGSSEAGDLRIHPHSPDPPGVQGATKRSAAEGATEATEGFCGGQRKISTGGSSELVAFSRACFEFSIQPLFSFFFSHHSPLTEPRSYCSAGSGRMGNCSSHPCESLIPFTPSVQTISLL